MSPRKWNGARDKRRPFPGLEDQGHIADASKKGAKVVTGGERAAQGGSFLGPTVFIDVKKRGAASAAPQTGVKRSDQGSNSVRTGTLSLYSEVKYERALAPGTGPSVVSMSPSSVTGPSSSSIPAHRTFSAGPEMTTPFLPMTKVLRAGSMSRSMRCSV